MIYCKALNEQFNTKADMYAALKERKDEIISLKKAVVKTTDEIPHKLKKTEATKSLIPAKELEYGDYVYPVINTTNYMDSHDDVHIPGIWNKSVKEQAGRTHLLINHDLSIGKVISYPSQVEPMVKVMKWSDLGANIEGQTEALIFKAKLTHKSNKDAFNIYKDGEPVQHSVRMQYVKMELAINDKNSEEEFEAWEKYYPMIANKDRADEQGYFFAVTEAKIFKEGSMVLSGSNEMTPTLYDIEPEQSTQKNEPRTSTQDTIEYLKQNFKL